MSTNKAKIIKELTLVPRERLIEIENFIKFILTQNKIKTIKKEPATLAGIWQGKGFEKIIDLDKEIRNTRIALSGNIIKKYER